MNVVVNVYGPPVERPKPPRFEELSLSDQLDKIELAILRMATTPLGSSGFRARAKPAIEVHGMTKKIDRNALNREQRVRINKLVDALVREGFGIDPNEVP